MEMPPTPYHRARAKTQAKFEQALLGLLEEKEYDAITIQDIADRAGVDRGSFYRYYPDKNALLQVLFDGIAAEWIPFLEPAMNLEAAQEATGRLLEYISCNSVKIRALSKTAAYNAFANLLKARALEKIKSIMPFVLPGADEKSRIAQQLLEMLVEHIVGAHFNLMTAWINRDLAVPKDTMLQVSFALVDRPVWELMAQIAMQAAQEPSEDEPQ